MHRAPPRAEAPRPAPAPAPKPAAPPVRDRAAIQNDIEEVLAEPVKRAAEPPPPPAPVEPEILDLTEEMAAELPEPEPEPMPDPASSNFRTIDGQPDVFFAETPAAPEPEPEFEPDPVYAAPAMEAPAPIGFDSPQTRSIMSQATSAAVNSAFNQLAQSVFTQNGQTIEGLVREMLRPMLKTWLDDNLPGLVERLVRAEIERVSRGR